jgi:cytochrome P450
MCNLYHAQLNEKYWPDAKQFKPERWIPGEKDYEKVNDFEAFFPFSSG